jgi:hypothetical protein
VNLVAVAMSITAMAGYSGPGNGMQLMRNESSSDSLSAMLGPGLQGASGGDPTLSLESSVHNTWSSWI